MLISLMKRDSRLSFLQIIVIFFLSNILNKFLYQDVVLQSVRKRLINKVLLVNLEEFSYPLIFVFSEKQLKIVNHWPIPADCAIKISLLTLIQLKYEQQWSSLINSGKVVVEGDIKIAQCCSSFLDAVFWNPERFLSLCVGDFISEGISRLLKKSLLEINELLHQQRKYFRDILVEEYRIFPSELEVLSFYDKVDKVLKYFVKLEKYFSKLERKYEARRN